MIYRNINGGFSMRLDKWLWCARFFKTRALASAAIKKGTARRNNQRTKPSQVIETGDEVFIRSGPYTHQITVLSLAKNRQSVTQAIQLYKENSKSIETRRLISEQMKANNAMTPGSKSRPTKRERRKLTDFKKNQSDRSSV